MLKLRTLRAGAEQRAGFNGVEGKGLNPPAAGTLSLILFRISDVAGVRILKKTG
jgi:hypothetical protein